MAELEQYITRQQYINLGVNQKREYTLQPEMYRLLNSEEKRERDIEEKRKIEFTARLTEIQKPEFNGIITHSEYSKLPPDVQSLFIGTGDYNQHDNEYSSYTKKPYLANRKQLEDELKILEQNVVLVPNEKYINSTPIHYMVSIYYHIMISRMRIEEMFINLRMKPL